MMGAHGAHGATAAGEARWISFVRRYGWRAYALPLLLVITVAAVLRGTPSAPPDRAAGQPTPSAAVGSTRTPERGTQVEGLHGSAAAAQFEAGAAPAAVPVTVRLGADVTSCASNSYHQLVLVSISQQHLWACEGARQVDSTPVTTGKTVDHDQTPLGSWRVQAKQRDRYLLGPGYRDYVRYWVPFNGDFGFHDASWQTMPFGSKDYPRNGSHGCVHLPTATMAWLYRWATVEQTVVTVEA